MFYASLGIQDYFLYDAEGFVFTISADGIYVSGWWSM